MDGELITRWTARVLFACWAARLLLDVSRSPSPRREILAAWAWTLGCAVYLAHIAAAFAFYHGWSHRAAWEHTAQRTAETVGLDWGGGVYFNYLAALLWSADVLLFWVSRQRGASEPQALRIRSFHRLTVAFMTFLVVNATVVFGPAVWKPVALAFVAVFVGLSARGRRQLRELAHARVADVPAAREPPSARHSHLWEPLSPAAPDRPKPSTPAPQCDHQ
jgi:hypothetical protein